jgi:hypothetical protein
MHIYSLWCLPIRLRFLTFSVSLIALKKKIQITEMLAAFSTSPDSSVSLADFERMMVIAGMV